MKSAQMKIDLENDIAALHRNTVKLKCTSSRHYCLPLRDEKEVWKKTEEIMLTLGDDKESEKNIENLHQQFSHPTSKRLIQLMKDAGIDDESNFVIVQEISKNCERCMKQNKKTPSRPSVSVNVAKKLHEVVAVDLTEFKKGS